MPKISPELLSVLRCPVTGSPLAQDGEELVTTAAGPSGEKLRYAIEDGIPLLLPPELLPAAAAAPGFQHDAGQAHPVPSDAFAAEAAAADAARARAASRPAER
jgi:uncharacterized protein